jgi:RimJ/RimL family protein N-acetyltransferase
MKSVEVRPFSRAQEYKAMIDYFHNATDSFLTGMGVDRRKLLKKDEWLSRLLADHLRDDARKHRFYLAWVYDGKQVGHSSINKIKIGQEACIHLHLWQPKLRRKGLGTEFFRASANFFIRRFRLKLLLCEPCADNPAPNRVLSKLGFRLVKKYRTVPGDINLEQDVNRYELNHEMA